MIDLSKFDPNGVSNPNNNIFGLPFSEEDARLVILPVPWEVTVSSSAGTARSADHIRRAALHVDLFDPEAPNAWKQGFFMRPLDKKILLKSDYLRKEAELYIKYISEGEAVEANKFMCKTLREVNEGSQYLNNWVYEQTQFLLTQHKLVALLGGDHSTSFGFIKALAEKHTSFGILQIDAHCDLRKSYENFTYSHASIMFNVLNEIPQVTKLVQVGVRDYSQEERDFLSQNNTRVVTFFDRHLKEKQYEGQSWKNLVDEMVEQLPEKVYISFDIDGLDPKLCPHTGTPVQGGLEAGQVNYLFRKVVQSGRQLVGFDLCEVGIAQSDWDANVGAHELFKLCNLLVTSNPV